MKKYAQDQVARLIAKFAAQAKEASSDANERAVHDLRVAIRRLSRGLRSFSQFFPGKSWKRIRRDLSQLMDAAANVRDRDIVAQLLEKAGVAKEAPIFAKLAQERDAAAQALQQALAGWMKADSARAWTGVLEL
jgi:CHAD domain-containing protein